MTLTFTNIEAFLDYKDLPETQNSRDLMAENKLKEKEKSPTDGIELTGYSE